MGIFSYSPYAMPVSCLSDVLLNVTTTQLNGLELSVPGAPGRELSDQRE